MERLTTHYAFGPKIRELREARGISLRRLAKRSGISKSGLSKIERGDVTPDLERVERIAAGLGFTLGQLMGGADARGIEERDTEIAVAGPRPGGRRVLAGEGMLEVRETFIWRGETFKAGLTRVHPDHEVCFSEHAGKLGPAYDKESGHAVLAFLERTRSGRRQRGWSPWRL
jgi:transcriptional regulator with XRE-family HTH domain